MEEFLASNLCYIIYSAYLLECFYDKFIEKPKYLLRSANYLADDLKPIFYDI